MRLIRFAAVTVGILSAGLFNTVQADPVRFYTDQAAWEAAVKAAGHTIETFQTTPENVAKANEWRATHMTPPGSDTDLGTSVLTYDKSNTGLSRSFTLTELNAHWYFNTPGTPITNFLEPGDGRKGEMNDDWKLQVPAGSKLYAVGFDLGDNDASGGADPFYVYDEGGGLLGSTTAPVMPPYTRFLGALSDTPIGSVKYDDDAGLDNIVIANFRLGGGASLALPDLLISSISYTPGTYAPGSVLTVTGTESNHSTVDVNNFYLQARLSKDTTWGNSDDVVVWDFMETLWLDGGEDSTSTYGVVIPSGTPAGSYYLAVRIDTTNVINESNESNNTWWSATANVVVSGSAPRATVVFTASQGGQTNVWRVGDDGSGTLQLTTDGSSYGGRISPDGSTIAFLSARDGHLRPWLMDSNGGNARPLSSQITSLVTAGVLAWSPAGDRIAVNELAHPNSVMYLVRTTDGQILNQFNYTGRSSGLDWIPGTNKLVITNETSANWSPSFELWTIQSDGTGLTRLTTNSKSDISPNLTADGKHIVWTYATSSSGYSALRLFVGDFDGSSITNSLQVTTHEASSGVWSPDGARIMYSRQDVPDYDLYVMNANGTGATLFLDMPGYYLTMEDWAQTGTATLPTIGRSPATLTASCAQGTNAGNQTFEVWNSGAGTLSYTIAKDAAWLSVSPASGTSTGAHNMHTVTYGTSGLSAGTYYATITISASGATNTPQTIFVTLAVGGLPDLIVESFTHQPEPSTAGGTVKFDVVVKNKGTAAAGPFKVAFWSQRSSAPSPSDTPEQTKDVAGLAAGASTSPALQFSLTAPSDGSYTAWVYVDHGKAVSESDENNNADSEPWNVGLPSQTAVRVVNASGAPGGDVDVAVELDSKGNANAVGFSLTFDPTVLTYKAGTARLGSGASGANLIPNENQVAQGRLGILLGKSVGQTFATGTVQILLATFTIAAGTPAPSTPVGFGDLPVVREAADAMANPIAPVSWLAGTVTMGSGWEADVAPRPGGNGSLTAADWTQVGRFAAGLDTPAAGSEFQKTDCAPRSTVGDGRLTASDWSQAGRYVAGLDPKTAAGGPTGAASAPMSMAGLPVETRLVSEGRIIRAKDATIQRGRTGSVTLELDAQGNENALGLSVTFDTALLTFVDAKLGSGAAGATLMVNDMQKTNGRVGLLIGLPAGQAFPIGTRAIAVVTFNAAPGTTPASTSIGFGDQPITGEVADTEANPLPASYSDGTVSIVPSTLVTTSPVAPTECPAVATKCPPAATQCLRASTACPPVATRCPAEDTQCPTASTWCPVVTTKCPAEKTACPPGATKCPPAHTQCPRTSTACPPSATRCPAKETVCPTRSTRCPEQETRCPAEATVCPTRATGCPNTETLCPAQRTVCPSSLTVCQMVETACPAKSTGCPEVATKCPREATWCPPGATKCPPADTQCPRTTTACPPSATRCPAESTQCPAARTACPSTTTKCPAEITHCPIISTRCPSVGAARSRPAK